MANSFSFDKTVKGTTDEVIAQVTTVLAAEGFGILTRIDVDAVLKKKIDVDFRPYVILGACNPVLAHQALLARSDSGMMLPCNVTVEKSGDDECLVRFIDPIKMMAFDSLEGDADLQKVAATAAEKIGRAAAALD